MNKNKLSSLLVSLVFCVGMQAQNFPVVFDFTSVRDTQNRYTGSLESGATLSTWTSPGGTTYNVLDLGGSNGYFNLSSQFGSMIKGLGSTFSISVDVLVPTATDISGNGNFIWCFSYSSDRGYLFLNAKETRYAITNRTYSQEQSVNPAQSLTKGKWVNIIYVQDGATGTVYVNNEQKAQNTAMTLFPSGIQQALNNNYLGRSPYNGDAYLRNALYKELRVYNTALTGSQRADLVTTVNNMNALSDAQAVAYDIENLFVPQVAYKQINLPTQGEYCTISWQTSNAEYLTTDGRVVKQETDRDVPVTLTATFTRGSVTQTKTYNVKVKTPEPYSHYLFAFFPSNDNENIYFAVGEDGYNYTTINNDQAVFLAQGNTVMGGLRDPHILRGEDGNFYMVATDMRSALGWASNRGMVLMKSPDLIHWTSSTVHFPTKYAGTYLANVTRVWAPETIYDREAGKYMIYFSILTNDGTVTYDKDFYCYANADFTDLEGEPVYFYDRGSATIDMNIVYNEADGLYHGFYKNEGSGGICKVTAERLTPAPGQPDGSQWGHPSGTLQQTNEAVEGAGVFRLINDDSWILMYDCYGSGHYQFCSSPDLSTFTFVKNTATSGSFTPRHGNVLPITEEEYQALLQAFPCPALTAETDPDADGNLNLTKERISGLCESTDGWNEMTGFRTHVTNSPYINGEAVINGTFLEHWRDGRSIEYNMASKTLRYLPAGSYKLQASCIATWQPDASVTVEGVTFFADDQIADVHTGNGVPERYTLMFDIIADDDYTTSLGMNTTAETTANWVGFDNFRLYFVGTEAEYHAALRQMQLDYVSRTEALYPQLCPALLAPLQQAVAAVDVEATDYSIVVAQLDRLNQAVEAAQEALATVILLREDAAGTMEAQSDAHVHVYRPLASGEWNTLCLPFAMSAAQVTDAFGENAVIKRLTSAEGTDNLRLYFTQVTSVEPNVPYIIKSDQVKDFYCVAATAIVPPTGTPVTELSSVSFCGNYTPGFTLSTSNYYLKANQIWKSPGGTKLKAFRAYFQIPSQQVKSVTTDFEEVPTAIEEVSSTKNNVPSTIFDLSGQRVKHLSRGTYIIDGKKVRVK